MPGRPPGPRPAAALTQRQRGVLGLFPRFWTLRWIRPTSPFSAPLRTGSRAEARGSLSIPRTSSRSPPRELSRPHRILPGPLTTHRLPLGAPLPTSRPPLPKPDPGEVRHEPHARRKLRQPRFRPASREGGASYGYAVQSECNTRGFGGADAAPPLGWGLLPTATFDEGLRGCARITWPIRSRRARASEGGSHS